MKLPNVYGYGGLFAYSGIDGINSYLFDVVGVLMKEPISIRFEFKQNWYKLNFDIKGEIDYKVVSNDMIEAETEKGNFFISFLNYNTIIGRSRYMPYITPSEGIDYVNKLNVDIYYSSGEAAGLRIKQEEDGYIKFVLFIGQWGDQARAGANRFIDADLDKIREQRYKYFENMPACKSKDPEIERLYYKALSVNKVNIFSPQGGIPVLWTTPDRLPHKHLWLWDSVFHAIGFLTYNKELAKDAIWAVLSQQWENGFVPLMMNPVDSADFTQPPILSYGVWEIYKATGDLEYLKKCAPRLKAYVQWDIDNRDKNNNNLLEWSIDEYEECRCGESGMDNSPRFDKAIDLDAVDFSSYVCSEAEILSHIFEVLGDKKERDYWSKIHKKIKQAINDILWCEKDGMYYDKDMNGEFSYIPNVANFITLFAGVPDKERAARLVESLTNPESFWTKLPVPTIPKNHPTHDGDMWRGSVWINFNYMIIVGLLRYGYDDIAKELKDKTLAVIKKWYNKYGCIYEFYNCDDEIPPFLLDRKGKAVNPPDWRKKMHSISDFNWTSALTIKMIQDL